MRAKVLRSSVPRNTKELGEIGMELREGVWTVCYFNFTNLSFDFKTHFERSCFISFYFGDHLTP